MMTSLQISKEPVRQLLAEIPFLNEIKNQEQYHSALTLVEDLFEDYESNRFLVDLLSMRIQEWESKADEFALFNKELAKLERGVPLLNTIIEQYHLKMDDLKVEIGSKSLVSQILNGKRSLTKQHIEKLSQRFHISPSAFFG